MLLRSAELAEAGRIIDIPPTVCAYHSVCPPTKPIYILPEYLNTKEFAKRFLPRLIARLPMLLLTLADIGCARQHFLVLLLKIDLGVAENVEDSPRNGGDTWL